MSQPGPSEGTSAFPELVAIAGSGTIACGLAACVMSHGGAVVMWARSDDSARRARRALARQRHGQELDVGADRTALETGTLVVEAVAEEPGVKQELLGALRELLS